MPFRYPSPVVLTDLPRVGEVYCYSIGIDNPKGRPGSVTYYYEAYDAAGVVVDRRSSKEWLAAVVTSDPAGFATVSGILKGRAYSAANLSQAGFPPGGVMV